MGRDQNTVAKRLREMAKKRKAEDKRVHRKEKKDRGPDQAPNNAQPEFAEEPQKNLPS